MAAVAAVAMGVKSGIVLRRRRRAWLALVEGAPRGHACWVGHGLGISLNGTPWCDVELLCFSDSSRWMSKSRSDTQTCHIQSAHVKGGHINIAVDRSKVAKHKLKQGLRLILTTHFSVGKLKMSPGALIANFLIKWNLESYVLLRIRVIMGILTNLYLMFFFSSLFFTRIYRSMVNFLDPAADATLLFPVWALILVGLRSSIHGRSSSGTFFELRNVLKLLVVAYMNLTRGSKLWRFPFWFFWGLLALQCFYKILARHIASKSLWNGRVYGRNGNESNFNPEICNPETGRIQVVGLWRVAEKQKECTHSKS
uniref:DUF4220 domain-containing protein n=1 Tax=Oryza glumipatula TaxID=40148 RepID=A0A0E0BLA4_9ORYZ